MTRIEILRQQLTEAQKCRGRWLYVIRASRQRKIKGIHRLS